MNVLLLDNILKDLLESLIHSETYMKGILNKEVAKDLVFALVGNIMKLILDGIIMMFSMEIG